MADVVTPHVGDRVLEIGAGIGNMSIHLMPRSMYWATDVNPYYLNYLETLRSTRPYMQVAYTDGMKAESYPAEQNFDTVVCLNVIEHVQDDVGALRNIRDHCNRVEQPLSWFLLVRSSTEVWTKCWDTVGGTQRINLPKLRSELDFKSSRY